MNHGIDEKNNQKVLFHVTEILECDAVEDQAVDKGVGNGSRQSLLTGIEDSGQRKIVFQPFGH